jgi:hypothetical protein
MAIKTYERGSNAKLSANFKASEFLCHGAGCCKAGKVDEKLVEILQKIRDYFGKPVHISSAYLCQTWNQKVGGVSRSYHRAGQAADIKVEDISPAQVAKYAEAIGVLGIGLYDSDADGHFVHVDTRTVKSFWRGHAQIKCTTFGEKPVQTVQLPVLQKGDQGACVKALQTLLGIKADGIFGTATDTALRSFQKKAELTPDGICGEKTWRVLLGVAA